MAERFRPHESGPREAGFVPTRQMPMELLRELQKLSESRSNVPTSGYVPRNEQHSGFSQSRRYERIPPHTTRYDDPIIDGLATIAKRSTPKKKSIWKSLKPREKVAAVAATAIGVGAVGLGVFDNPSEPTDRHIEDLNSTPIVHFDDPSIPGHDAVVSTTVEPSVTVTSAPPGRTPLNIKIPKK